MRGRIFLIPVLLLITVSCGIPIATPMAPSQSSRSSGGSTVSPSGQAPSTAVPVTGSTVVSLPVTPVAMQYALGAGPTGPSSVTVTIPNQWVGLVGAYWADQVVLAPAGWTGRGIVGADGSESLALYPPGGSASSGQRITLVSDGACVGCGDWDAAQYFSAISDNWSQYAVIPNQAPPPTVQVLSEFSISADMIGYRMPNTPSGLEINGVVYSGLVDQAVNVATTFENVRAYLPAADHSMATLILNWAIQHDF